MNKQADGEKCYYDDGEVNAECILCEDKKCKRDGISKEQAIYNLKQGKCIPHKHETLTYVIQALQADGEHKSNKELLCDSCYRKIAGCQAKFHNPHPVDHCIEYKPIETQADGEKTCGTCRNEDTYHCAECENKSDYEQSQADGEYISRNNAITSICQWGTTLERTGIYTITVAEMKQTTTDMLCELPSVDIPPDHDGCKDCVYQDNPQDAMPCRECKQNYMDKWKARPKEEPRYCDRNICLRNEYNSIGCNECEVTKSQESNTVIGTGDGAYYRIKALQAQADGDLTTALCSLPKIQSSDGQEYVQLYDVLETVRRYKPSVAIPNKTEPKHWIHRNDDYNDWLECPSCGYGSEGEVKYGKGTPYCQYCGERLYE
jgi:hypothetical protein